MGKANRLRRAAAVRPTRSTARSLRAPLHLPRPPPGTQFTGTMVRKSTIAGAGKGLFSTGTHVHSGSLLAWFGHTMHCLFVYNADRSSMLPAGTTGHSYP